MNIQKLSEQIAEAFGEKSNVNKMALNLVLTSAFREFGKELIGEDQSEGNLEVDWVGIHRNQLRAEQRKKLSELLGGV